MIKTKRGKALAVISALAMVASVATLTAPASAAKKPVTIVIWDTGLLARATADGKPDMKNSFLHQAAASFTKLNPGITVKIVQQGGDITSNGNIFQAASIAKTGPDMRVQFPGGPTLSYAKHFLDLSKIIPKATYNSMVGWDFVREDYKSKGKVLALPYGAGLYFVVFQNNKVLTDAGLDPKKTPKTFEEMMANAQIVKDKTSKNGFWISNQEGYVGAWVVGGLLGGLLGGDYAMKFYTGALKISNNPSVIKAYEAFASLYSSGLSNPDAGQASIGDSDKGWAQFNSAYYILGSWQNNVIEQDYGKSGTQMGWFYLPMLAGSKYPNAVAGGPQIGVSITAYSKYPKEAAKFLLYLAQPKVQDLYVKLTQVEASSHVNANPGVITNSFLSEQATVLKSRRPVVYGFDSVMPQSVIDLFYKLNNAAFLGTMSPSEVAQALETQNRIEISNRK